MPEFADAPIEIGPQAYVDWRNTPLGAITERIEQRLIRELVGAVSACRVLDIGCGDGSLACDLSGAVLW